MKVCTDACLFGAWLASKIENEKRKIENALDIGTGTGLLSLMLAQKLQAKIDAIEIDEAAAQQAKENFDRSPFAKQLQLFTKDIKAFEPPHAYDLIFSNPPFFDNDLKSISEKRNMALHSETLSFKELLLSVERLLGANGFFAVLLPFRRMNVMIELANEKKLFLQEQVLVKQTEKHTCFRSMLLFSRIATQTEKSEIVIKNEGSDSAEFFKLLKDYYLYL